MYVCVCHAVTERQVRDAIDQGATKLRDLRRELGICSDCGKCGPCAREMLAEARVAAAEPLGFPAVAEPQPAV